MKLVIEDDEGNRQEFPVDGVDEVTIGRAPSNSVRLDQRNVSRQHARLFREAGVLVVEDLKSRNGTLVNGQRLTASQPLQDGDLLRIGDYSVVLQHDTDTHRIQVVEADTVETPAASVHDTAPHLVASLVAEVQPRLLVLGGRLRGTLFTIGRSEVRVGKDPAAELSLPHRRLADFQCKLVQTGVGEWHVQGLGGANVRVNGVALADTPLRDGDILELAGLRLRFVGPGAPVPPLPARTKSRLPWLAASLGALALLGVLGARQLRHPLPPAALPSTGAPAAPREEPVLELSPTTVAPPPPVTSADPLAPAKAALEARDYAHALQLLGGVKDPRRASEVSALRKTARTEAAAGRAVAAAQRELDAGRPGAALRQLKGARGTRAWALEAEVVRSKATEALRKPVKKPAPRAPPAAGETQTLQEPPSRDRTPPPDRAAHRSAKFARCRQAPAMPDWQPRFRGAGPAPVAEVKKTLEDSDKQKKATA
jgi:ABC transport system ATP-binding/permease protein